MESKILFNGTAPMYVQVRDELLGEIASLEAGDKLPAERELSARFKVDRVTIRRAMQDLEREGYIVRRRSVGTFVIKAFNANATANVKSEMIGLVIPDVEITFCARILKGVEEEALRSGHGIVICNSLLDTKRERSLLAYLAEQSLAGILIMPYQSDSIDPEYARLVEQVRNSCAKIVFIDQYITGLDVSAALIDKVRLGYMAAEHLIVLGHKRIAYACPASYDVSGASSLRGFKMALKDYDVELREDLIFDIPAFNCAKPTRDAVVNKLTQDRRAFTAIAAPNFSMTYGIVEALNEMGAKMPEDIALVGGDVFDGQDCEYITHTLQPAKEMGAEALRLLLRDETEETLKRHSLIKPELVISTTCGAATANAPKPTGRE